MWVQRRSQKAWTPGSKNQTILGVSIVMKVTGSLVASLLGVMILSYCLDVRNKQRHCPCYKSLNLHS